MLHVAGKALLTFFETRVSFPFCFFYTACSYYVLAIPPSGMRPGACLIKICTHGCVRTHDAAAAPRFPLQRRDARHSGKGALPPPPAPHRYAAAVSAPVSAGTRSKGREVRLRTTRGASGGGRVGAEALVCPKDGTFVSFPRLWVPCVFRMPETQSVMSHWFPLP